MSNQIKNQYFPDIVSPPGETLLEVLEEQGISQAELARRMGRPNKTINEIVQGKAAITPDTAIQLERVLDISADFWNNRQLNYDQSVARLREREQLTKWTNWLNEFSIGSMIDFGWIVKHEDLASQVDELLRFFGVASPEQWQQVSTQLAAAFRQSKAYKSGYADLSAWLRRGEIVAKEYTCRPFNRELFYRLLLGDIRKLTQERVEVFQRELKEMCSDCGVAVVFVRELPYSRVSGVTRWLASDKALIQLSLRYKTNDQLWFTFYHESGHILLHGKRNAFIEGSDEDSLADKEKEANQFAADALIPPDALKDFLNSINPNRHLSCAAIQEFADSIGVAPGIVVGRLQHDELPSHNPLEYRQCNYLKQYLEWAGSKG